MLPAHLQELLTAAVDGELTHAERRMVDTLLRDSQEARAFHAQLIRDAEKLRRAAKVNPADDFASSIMSIINERGMRPTPLPTRRRHSTWNSSQFLPWFSIATAALVLIAVSLFSYLFFATQQQPNEQNKNSANNQPKEQPKADSPRIKPNEPKINEPQVAEKGGGPQPREVESRAVAKIDRQPDPEMLPNPRIAPPDLHAIEPPPDPEPFRIERVQLSLFFPLRDLDQPYPKQQLCDELKKYEMFRVDLFCRDSVRANGLLQNALKAGGQQVLVDALAQDLLKKRSKTDYVFYTESFSADEIASLLEALGAADKRAETKKAGDGTFEKFLLSPITNGDVDELAKLLGVRSSQLKLPKVKLGFDPRKSLESNTANTIASTLPKSNGSRNEKWTLVVPNGPFAKPDTSKEIKSFLEKRGERKPGAIPFMLVLRTLG